MSYAFTLDELASAWERVAENEGCAGVDGETIERFAARVEQRLGALRERLEAGVWRPLPLLKILVEKSPGGKERRLLVPAVRDRVVQTAVARHLSRSYEDEFLESSFAYRPGRGVDRAIARVIQWRDRGYLYVVDADIEGYFDSVDQSLLLQRVAEGCPEEGLLGLVRDSVKAQYWDGERVRRLVSGIPQGSPLSPLLANLFLNDFDTELGKSGHHLVRYADDFLILCKTEQAAGAALAVTHAWMEAQKLRLKDAKTRLTSFAQEFQFLGVHFRGEEALIPWKGGRPKGRVTFMAPPMPPRMLARWQHPERRTAMEAALRSAGVVAAPRPRTGEEQPGWHFCT